MVTLLGVFAWVIQSSLTCRGVLHHMLLLLLWATYLAHWCLWGQVLFHFKSFFCFDICDLFVVRLRFFFFGSWNFAVIVNFFIFEIASIIIVIILLVIVIIITVSIILVICCWRIVFDALLLVKRLTFLVILVRWGHTIVKLLFSG